VFSFARAIQHSALNIRLGQDVNLLAAQQALLHRANRSQAVGASAMKST